MAEKINGNMSIQEMIFTVCEGNPGAMMVIMGMISDPTGVMDILMLDGMDIRGEKLYMLNNDCCKRNPAKFKRTLMMIRSGVFTQEQIRANLERCHALPFIDDSIKIDGVPPYGEDFGPGNPMWEKWCEAQKESFEQRSSK